MTSCVICPRRCAIDRAHRQGYCKAPWEPVVANVTVHMWEEPLISGGRGSGTVFFAGCNLGCVFCQNHEISQSAAGKVMAAPELADIFVKLEVEGVHNINLVTPGHFAGQIAEAIALAKGRGVKVPFVYNSNGYDAVPSLKLLDGLVDIYMPDLKYFDDAYGRRYSNVPDYFTVASKALPEMFRQVGRPVIRNGVLKKGLLIRHLVMPGLREDSLAVLDWIKANVPSATVNVMSQYRPAHRAWEYKEIDRRPTAFEYQSVMDYSSKLGLRSAT